MSSIESIKSSIHPTLVEAPKVKVADTLKTTPITQQTSHPAATVTLGQPNSQANELYSSSGVTGKSSPHAISGSKTSVNSSPSASASTTQPSSQNQKQLDNYSVIQQTTEKHQSDRSGSTASFLA